VCMHVCLRACVHASVRAFAFACVQSVGAFKGELHAADPEGKYSVVLCWVLVGSASVYPLTHGSDYADERSTAPLPPRRAPPARRYAHSYGARMTAHARTCSLRGWSGGPASRASGRAGPAGLPRTARRQAGLRCSCVFAGGQPLLAGHDAHFAPISVGAPQHVAPQAHEADYDMVPPSSRF
jgi:hypothetical protein